MDRDPQEGSTAGAVPTDESLRNDRADSFLAEVARISNDRGALPGRSLEPASQLARGRIQLGRCIGQGGMGVVYEALDRERGEMVALKTTSFLDGPAIYRLKQEFRALKDVVHPNLVRLGQLHGDDGFWFFTMELVEGERFDRWVRPQGQLDEGRLRDALPGIVAAVDAIHCAHKVHRDLKPSNVLVTHAGRVVVLDFGLVTDREHGVNETCSNGSGTPGYMAPEQAMGVAATVASDLYAIGVMLFEALTGRLPFEGSAERIRLAKQTLDPPAVRSIAAAAPADLSALADALVQREPSARPDMAYVLEQVLRSAPPRTSSQPPSVRPSTMLLGRSRELDELREAYRFMREEGAAVVFVSGESGIGKTALVEAFLAELKRDSPDAVVLQGRCYERELVPFKAFDSLIDDLSRFLRRLRVVDAAPLMPRNVSALARLFPVLERLDVVRDAPKKEIKEPQELRRHAFAAFIELMARIRDRRPLVIYIDDLQWLDADSAFLLEHLLEAAAGPAAQRADSLEAFRVLLISTHRTEATAPNPLLSRVIRGARNHARLFVRERLLGPLEDAAVKQLTEQLLGDASPELTERIASEARGVPFFARELARRAAFLDQRTLTLPEALHAHVAELPPQASEMLRVVATAARPIAEKIVMEAAKADYAFLDRLRAEQLVRNTSGSAERMVECYHDRIRETVFAAMSGEEVRARHHRLMDALLHSGNADPEQLAVHCVGAGECERASHYATLAADAAHAALAFERAVDLYRMAIEYLPEGRAPGIELEEKLAQALSDRGWAAEAAPHFMRAADGASREKEIELRRRAAEQWLVSGGVADGKKELQKVLAAVGLRLPENPDAAMRDLLWLKLRLMLRGLEFEHRSEADIPASELLRVDACKTAWSLSFVSTLSAAAFQARHLLYALEAGEPKRVALGFGMEAIYRSMSGRSGARKIDELQSRARALVDSLKDPHVEAFSLYSAGNCSYLFGDWRQACESLEHAEQALVQTCKNVGFELNSARFFWANALVFRGRWKELEARLTTWLKDAELRGDHYARATLLLVRARSVTLATGDTTAVRAEIDEAMQLWPAEEFGVQRFLEHVSRLQVDLYEGQVERALARSLEIWSKLAASKMDRIQVCRVTAHQHAGYIALAMTEKEPSARQAWLRTALKHASKLRAEKTAWATGFALFIEASVEQLRGRDAAATDGLTRALQAFEHADMHCYAAATALKLGHLIGGDEGNRRLAYASQYFDAEAIAEPFRLTNAKAPGVDAKRRPATSAADVPPALA